MLPDQSLEVRFRHRLGTLNLDVDFRTSAPWTVLFGPSGSGKSTILRAIAGVLRPDQGRIVIDGQVVFDASQKLWLPPHQRPMRWAPQRAMLDPMKNTLENLAMAGVPPEGVLSKFGLEDLASRFPDQLSGGQRQSLGVIRAAAGLNGRHLLLDEPFTGLDAAIRHRLIENLRTWIKPCPVLSVTHDVEEAFLLNAEVIRIAEGRITAQGPTAEILAQERQRVLHNLKAQASNERSADSSRADR